MRELSVIEEVFLEEYRRSLKIKQAIEREQADLPKGSLQVKNIHGCSCYYLQYRDGEKIKSKYVPASDVDDVQNKISRRRQNKQQIRNLESSLKQLEKVLGKDVINEIAAERVS